VKLEPLPRGLLIVLGLAGATVAVAGLKAVSSLAAPAFLALVLTIAVHPVRGWLLRWHLPGWVVTLLMTIVVYALLLGLALSLVIATARFATLLPTYRDEFNGILDDIKPLLQDAGIGSEQISGALGSFDLGRLANAATVVISSLLSIASNLFFILALLLFMAMDSGRFPGLLEGTRGERQQVVEAMQQFAHGTRTYLVVSTIFGAIVAVIDAGALWLLDIPEPLLWGLLAFITNFVPNIGFVIGLIPPAILGLLEGGPGTMLAVIATYCVINVTIQSVIQPRIVGDAVGLSTSLTFLSLVFWTWVLGGLGALLAIPLTLLAKALLVDVDENARWVSPLLSGGATGHKPDREGEPEPAEPATAEVD
jgi:predicted PurR-regulated permease PerM